MTAHSIVDILDGEVKLDMPSWWVVVAIVINLLIFVYNISFAILDMLISILDKLI